MTLLAASVTGGTANIEEADTFPLEKGHTSEMGSRA